MGEAGGTLQGAGPGGELPKRAPTLLIQSGFLQSRCKDVLCSNADSSPSKVKSITSCDAWL